MPLRQAERKQIAKQLYLHRFVINEIEYIVSTQIPYADLLPLFSRQRLEFGICVIKFRFPYTEHWRLITKNMATVFT